MNPPSPSQTQVRLRLEPVPQIWSRPHALNAAISSILNAMLDSKVPVTVETFLREGKITIRISQCPGESQLNAEPELCFAVVEGRIRASGWDLFAARQLVRQNGGDIRLQGQDNGEQQVTMWFPADLVSSAAESKSPMSLRA